MNSFIVSVLIVFVSTSTSIVAPYRYSNAYSDEFDGLSESVESDESVDFDYVPDTLLMVNVLFRHGNRTADSQAELYPNDPFKDFEYFPYGLGQLTLAGKRKEYSLGRALRERYENFLGDHYYPEIVEARSTDYNRTKMSLQLVLAGLFPPRKDDVFSDNLEAWQPVPYNYVPRNEDYLLLGNLCPRYEEMYNKYIETKRVKKVFRYFSQIAAHITKHSGKKITKLQDVYNMYFGISTESEYGLDLPSWLNSVWPKQITTMAVSEYRISMGTKNMRKILAGYLLQKMIKDFKDNLADDRVYGRKINLYSAHENNLAQLLIALDIFDDRIPNYGSYVLLELHRINGIVGVKVFYQNYYSDEPKILTVKGCRSFCPLNEFESILYDVLPQPSDELC